MTSKKASSVMLNNSVNTSLPPKELSFSSTFISSVIMGFVVFCGSFSAVPIAFTVTALICGSKSYITIFATALGQLAAGYLHSHAARSGMALSTEIFHGFYLAKPDMRNRRKPNEKRSESLKRFFVTNFLNALVLNLMWESFTFYYIVQSTFMIKYTESFTSQTPYDVERRLILMQGFTRSIAGSLSGITVGIINQLWQRYLAQKTKPNAIFNTNKTKLRLNGNERKKLLSPFNIENWIKLFSMIPAALFIVLSGIPNRTNLHLLDVHKKKYINDILVMNCGWIFFRDVLMLVSKTPEKSEKVLLNTLTNSSNLEQSLTLITNDTK